MIENELAPMPTSHPCHETGQERNEQTMRQHVRRPGHPQTPVEAGEGDECYRSDRMRPTRHPFPDAWYRKKLDRAHQSCREPEKEHPAGAPKTDPQPERISRPPEKQIDRQCHEGKRDREMHAHCMKRVTGNSNRRAGVLLFDLRNDGVFGLSRFFQHISPFIRQSPGTKDWFRRLCCAGILLPLGGCSGDFSALDPAGPSAASIASLWWAMLWGSFALFTLVLGLFLAAVLVPRFGRGVSQTRWIILGGLVLPLPVLTGLTFYAFAQGEFLLKGAVSEGDEVLEIRAIGRMWQWQFSYPSVSGSPVHTDLLHIPAGRTVEIIAESEDVIHSFWVPRLGGKIDAVPGHSNRLRIRADQPGRYGGICSEYCGTGHAGMQFEVQAHRQEDFREVVTGGFRHD